MPKSEPLTKKALMETLLEFHREVEEPMMEQVLNDIKELKGDVKELKGDVSSLKSGMSKVEIQMEDLRSEVADLKKTVWRVADHQGNMLDNHEKRISALES